ncbi:MAG: SBBP repeat-containing protein [Anaerolineales bacterium]|nr:SBBP repeat-containing protein [Anaerolineales bacterium]MBX3037138.1 SBBP repeat-containing protein [Anaerolineales bacterium]
MMRNLNFPKVQFISITIVITLVFSVFGSAKALPSLTTSSRLAWNTFLGGPGFDFGSDIVVDLNGYIYVVGTSSGYYIDSLSTFTDPTWGYPLNPYAGGEGDGFVTKLSPNGTLIWNTFLGGADRDVINNIVLDENGNIYVTGNSRASWGSPLQPFSSYQDGFIAKLNSSGTLLWHTFLDVSVDGTLMGHLTGIDFDEDGNIFVTGNSEGDWDIVDTPLNPHSGDNDIFVAKLTHSGDFSWYTFLGGTARDTASRIAIGDDGNIHIVGTSNGTWGSPVRAFSGTFWNAFVAEIDSSGTLLWNTFLGAGRDWGGGIKLDEFGNIYVVGTSSSSWGSPIRAFEGFFGALNGFTTKLNTNGSLVWNTFLGNGSNESYAVGIDDDGYLYIVGSSCSSWGNPFNSISNCPDGNIIKLENTGELIANGYIGGEGSDYSSSLFVQDSENIFVMGFSELTWGNPIRPAQNDIEPSINPSPTNIFVAKLNLDTTPPTVNTIECVNSCTSNMLNVSYFVTFSENVTGVDVSDFALDTSGVVGAFVSNVSGSGNTRIVGVSTGQGSGTIQLNFVDNDSVTDLATNPTTSGLSGETYTINKPQLKAPVLRSPRSSGAMNDTTPNFIWQRVAGAQSYEIQIDNNNDFSSPEDSNNAVTGTNYTSIVLPEGTYYWRVRANDVSANPGQWSLVRTITIDTTGPVAPTLISPADTFNSPNRTTTFRWQSSNGAVQYQFAYDNDANCLSPISTATLRGTSRRATLPSGIYYWCVRAKDSLGNWGDWSTPYQINIP